MSAPKKFGIAIEDLPEGALGMPIVIFEDNVEFEEVYRHIMEQKDGSNDDEGPK